MGPIDGSDDVEVIVEHCQETFGFSLEHFDVDVAQYDYL